MAEGEPKIDQRAVEVTEKIKRGECAYYQGGGQTGTGYLYIPHEKMRVIVSRNPDDSRNPFGSHPKKLETLHAQVFDGSYSLGIQDVGSSYMMELPATATSEQVQQLIDLIDAEVA